MDSAAGREETEIPSLERLFDVGSLLPVYVTSVDGGRSRIGLSVNPRLVNSHITAKDVKPGLVRNWTCIEHHLDLHVAGWREVHMQLAAGGRIC